MIPKLRFVIALTAVLLMGSFCVSSVEAQALGRIEQTETNVGAYYHFAERGTATVKIFVMGSVASPGIYEVSDGTKMETLLVLSRPGSNTRDGSGIGRQKMMIRLLRSNGAGRDVIYESELSEAMERSIDHPVLREGDLLMVEVRGNRIDWRDVLRIAQTLAVFGLAIDRFARRF